MALQVPGKLVEICRRDPQHSAWLDDLPNVVARLCERWELSLSAPFEDATAAWVAPTRDGRAVLKLGLPHMEAEHELAGLRYWNGDGVVRLLMADDAFDAMLLERCEPGTTLRSEPERVQDEVIATLLKRLWRRPEPPHPFRPLSDMTAQWEREVRAKLELWPDRGLVEEGLRVFQALARSAGDDVLLATDLHAGNVLRAQREPWLAIDPKPFVGDRAYDATQHLFNCRRRLLGDPDRTIGRMADLLGLDAERLRLWVFARAAIDSNGYDDPDQQTFARALAPP